MRTALLGLLIIVVGGLLLFFLSSKMLQKKITLPTKGEPTQVITPLADVLFPTKTPDDLPQNTLEIPREKWGEKLPALAQRVLKYFQDQGVAPLSVPTDKVELYQAFLGAWGKPWRVHYLTTNFDKEELNLIWNEVLLVQANTPEELEKQKQIVVTTLQKVQPSAELPPDTDISNHFKTQDDINSAIQKGTLVEVKTQNIKISEKSYVTSELANFISTDLDPKLKDYKDVLEISSATRFLKLQILLKEKLGYLAASISYHTKGAAIDLKLSEATKKRFDVYLKEKTRLDQATVLYQNNTPLTISNLIKNGVVDENNEGAQVFRIIEDLIKEKGVELIDETFFGIRLDKDGNITEINPVFHLQYKAS